MTRQQITKRPGLHIFYQMQKYYNCAALIEPSYVVTWVVGTHRYVLTTIRSLWSANRVIVPKSGLTELELK